MFLMRIDGGSVSGHYYTNCQCGEKWEGLTDRDEAGTYCPALPIAECAVHIKYSHPDDQLELTFSNRFSEWLKAYWESQSLLQATRLEVWPT
jgi:hypothetical protein